LMDRLFIFIIGSMAPGILRQMAALAHKQFGLLLNK
jgi:hypothetical protein